MTIIAENDNDYHHLFNFEDVKDDNGNILRTEMRDVESLICLFAMALLMNALDKCTYIPFAQAGTSLTAEECK
jgi:hypothetical protein